jgi:hypothetical protein
MKQKDLILRLIKDDLINTYLIDSFEKIGFYSSEYRLNLSDTVFKLLGIDNDELYELYLLKCSEIAKKNLIKDKILLEEGTREIYDFLCK